MLTGRNIDCFALAIGQREGGKDDPKLCLLRFDPGHAEIWKDASSVVAGVKLFLGLGDPKKDFTDSVATIGLK